ncbi:MAG: hypothetical protein MJ236_04705, partial [Clostridia bacterium]|nr:hypothetical protein [Clostridia bacterium]
LKIPQEKESSSFINKTSFIENCETSAVGRALGFAGIGSKTSIASAEEVRNAINNQPKDEGTKVKEALEAAKARGAATEEITYESALIMKVNEKSLKDWYKCDKDFIAQLRETGTEQIKKAIGIIDAKIAAYNKK